MDLTPQNFNLFEANIYLPESNKTPLVILPFWQWFWIWFSISRPCENEACNKHNNFGRCLVAQCLEKALNICTPRGWWLRDVWEVRTGEGFPPKFLSIVSAATPSCKVTVAPQRGGSLPCPAHWIPLSVPILILDGHGIKTSEQLCPVLEVINEHKTPFPYWWFGFSHLSLVSELSRQSSRFLGCD